MSKRVNNFFKSKITFMKMYEAYLRSSKCKHENKEVIEYEMDLAMNLSNLVEDVKNKTYKTGFYRKFTVYEPKERIILSLPFKDRVLQQWYVEEFIKPIFMPKLVKDTYACLKGKGLHSAVKNLQGYMRKKYTILRMSREEMRFSPRLAGRLVIMGVPMGLQYSVTAIGSVILQSAVNVLGSMAVASVTAASKISMFFCCPFDALGATMATFAGQNVGAGKPDRIRSGLRTGNLFGFAYAVAAFVFLMAAGRYVALLFVDASETEILGNVQRMLTANS